MRLEYFILTIQRYNALFACFLDVFSQHYHFIFYGRTLSDASMLYFADVFLYIFYARLSWPNG